MRRAPCVVLLSQSNILGALQDCNTHTFWVHCWKCGGTGRGHYAPCGMLQPRRAVTCTHILSILACTYAPCWVYDVTHNLHVRVQSLARRCRRAQPPARLPFSSVARSAALQSLEMRCGPAAASAARFILLGCCHCLCCFAVAPWFLALSILPVWAMRVWAGIPTQAEASLRH